MGFLSFLTGGSDVAEKVVDGVSSGLDVMFYTDEEKSQANQKILDWKLAYAKATAAMSISRRIIVCGVCFVWIVLVLLLIIVASFAGNDSQMFKDLFDIMKDVVNPPFMIIVAFYFLAHVVGNARK